MAVYYTLHKKNSKNASMNGKVYATASYNPDDVVDINRLSESITQETVLTDVEVIGVVRALIRHMTNALHDGKKVRLDGFGQFKIGIASTGAESFGKFTVADNIKGVRCVFQPSTKIDRANKQRIKTFLSGITLRERISYNEHPQEQNP